MNKVWILLIIAIIISTQASFLSSFHRSTIGTDSLDDYNAHGTSAVIVAKTHYLSLRIQFFIQAKPGETALIIFPNGTQKNVTSSYQFEVFLGKTESSAGSYAVVNLLANIPISDNNPVDAVIKANVSEDFFNFDLTPNSPGKVVGYWFKVQGNARVRVSYFGVTI